MNDIDETEQRFGGNKMLLEKQKESKEDIAKINTLDLAKEVKDSHESIKDEEYRAKTSFYGGSTSAKMSSNQNK